MMRPKVCRAGVDSSGPIVPVRHLRHDEKGIGFLRPLSHVDGPAELFVALTLSRGV